MSKYLTFTDVVFKERDLLVAALEDIGCNQIGQGEDLEMGSYYSEQSKQKVAIVIPRDSIGNRYGDIGFERTESGDYIPIIDDFDRCHALNGKFITQLCTAYNERVVKRVAARLHRTIHRTVEGGIVKIKFVTEPHKEKQVIPEVYFTVDIQTGEMEIKMEGIKGPQCADVAKIVTELIGTPEREENTSQYYERSNVRPQIQNRRKV
jgi:Protein of unknown function (DUF1257)